MVINGKTFNEGDSIVFRSIHPDDVQEYSGRVMGFGNINIARLYTDVAAYHAGITDLTGDTPTMNYVIVEHQDMARAWHPDWLTDVQKPERGAVTLTVYYGSDERRTELLNILKSNNFTYTVQ